MLLESLLDPLEINKMGRRKVQTNSFGKKADAVKGRLFTKDTREVGLGSCVLEPFLSWQPN